MLSITLLLFFWFDGNKICWAIGHSVVRHRVPRMFENVFLDDRKQVKAIFQPEFLGVLDDL